MLKIGVDYYPEHWDQEMWEQDARLMEETGVKIVRVAEFAWSKLEPTEGDFQFAWLDEAIEVLHAHGMQIVLGTPTATPPNWLIEKYPDILPVDQQLHPQYPGVRGHRCYNSPSLRKYTEIIVEKLSQHYANHPAIIGWQTDNEFGFNACNCTSCNRHFRKWLMQKYGSLEMINKEWGNVVWSGEYSNWNQVTTPLGGSNQLNPSYLLDYHRFQNDSAAEFQQLQIDILRKNCPHHFVTHNIWSYPTKLDYYKIGENLDFVSLDYYPSTSPAKVDTNLYSGALTLDLTRGIKDQNFWIMETISGPPGCWFPMWRTPRPGFLRSFAWQCFARGADTVVHFRWRSATSGAEQFWHGLLDHSNVPGRRFKEFTQLCQEVNLLSEQLDGSTLHHQVALLHSHEQYIAFDIQPQVEGMDYFENLKLYHRALTKLGIGSDVINERAILDGYKLVVVPHLFLLEDELAKKLHNFAANGGILVITHRTGVKNDKNVCWMKPLPGPLAETVGAVVEEYDPIGKDIHKITLKNGETYESYQWCDILETTSAEVIAEYADDFFAGKPAITCNKVGKGKVYYVGTTLEENFYLNFFQGLVRDLELQQFKDLPEGVQVTTRSKDGENFLFVLNLSPVHKVVTLDNVHYSLLNKQNVGPKISLEPYSVEILK